MLAASMPVRAIQQKWAPRAELFPWEIGGYMALAVLIALVADGLAWALDIGVAVLTGAAAACIVQFALSRNLSMANSAGQRVRAKILTHYVLGTMEGRVAEAFRKADENPQDGQARRDAQDLGNRGIYGVGRSDRRHGDGRGGTRGILAARSARTRSCWKANTRSSTVARRDLAWIAMNSSSGARTGAGA